jgi:hypothetical protein
MANRKISDLTALTAPATGDLLPIVDISEAVAADKNKKITYGELLSSAPAGSAAAPSFSFDGDPNSGLYSAGADQVAISTGGSGRLFVDSLGRVTVTAASAPGLTVNSSITLTGVGTSELTTSDASGLYLTANAGVFYLQGNNGFIFRGAAASSYAERLRITSAGNVGIGTTSPSRALHVNAAGDHLKLTTATTGTGAGDGFDIKVNASTSQVDFLNYENSDIAFWTNVAERARIDSSGRLLVGTSSARTDFYSGGSGQVLFQVEGTTFAKSSASLTRNSNDNADGAFVFAKSRATADSGVTVVQADDNLGEISWQGADGVDMVRAARHSAAE